MLKKITERTFLMEIAKIGSMLVWFLVSSLKWITTPKDETSIKEIFIFKFTESLAGYLTLCIFFIILSLVIKKKIISKKLLIYIVLPVIYIFSILWAILDSFFYSIYVNELVIITGSLMITSLYFLTPLTAVTCLYFLIDHWLNLKKQKEMTMIATNLANEAQLQMLRYQINPHFLFNSLNTIRSMIEEDKEVARKMVTELSNFFRYSLSHNGTTDIFENEMNAIKNYLAIQKIRFEEKLVVEYDIDEKINSMKIPFFIILPLVENAIKFGLQTSKKPLSIKICAKVNNNLEISVHNSGKIAENSNHGESTKTGIENTKKRLALYFPDNYAFQLFEENGWVISQILIKDYKNQVPENKNG
jgi:sensor histidine kinase YesM